jgi:nitroimidazol reductase NimA-like FMN-containing flavoprotein (pyridoxamine 5'-phosphate oxidase superfamily)
MHAHELQKIIDRSYANATPFTKKVLGKPMTAEETIDFINEKRDGILASVKASGKPHISWQLLAYLEGKLYAGLDRQPLAYRNLMERPDAAIAITDHSKGVFIEGTVRVIGTAAELRSSLLARIEGWSEDQRHTGRWLPKNFRGDIIEIKIQKLLTYNPK